MAHIPDCSQHKKEVAGISDMKVLAEMIGDLHYESLTELLFYLSQKIWEDGKKDYHKGRYCISSKLFQAYCKIYEAQSFIAKAWQISKSFMENKNK